jgi:hypothetical protein
VELWGSALWHSAPAAGTELPELPGPPPRGVIDRPGVQAFLDAHGAGDVLPELLTAVGRAMAGGRPVLVATQDATENAWWIAAVSYLLGERLARRMTFTTYSHRPGYSRYHLTGTLPGSLPPEADASFQMFDFAAGRMPGEGAHPLATILVSTGVMASPGLWQQAAAFASGAEDSLDDWLPAVAVSAALLGRRLSPGQADTVARWLPGAAGWMPPGLADVGLGVALAQPDGMLADERLHELLDLARRLAAPARVEQLERLLADRAVARISRGEPAAPVRFGSPAVEAARELAVQALDGAGVPTALAVLEWTAASGIALPEAELERYGRMRLGPAVPERELARMVRFHPAIRRGLLERLAGEPQEVTRAVLRGPVGSQLGRDDLARHPELTELWLLQSVAEGSVKPMRAFDEIVDIRSGTERSPVVDAPLLHLLWPRGCPPEDLAELLGILTDPPAPDIVDWFAAQIGAISARATVGDGWVRLARALDDHSILAVLPEQDACSVRNTVRLLPLLERARLAGPRGDADVFAELFTEFTAADGGARRLLERELPALLARAQPLGMALRGCPGQVAAAFCRKLDDWLAPMPADIPLAWSVFSARCHPEVLAQPALSERLAAAFEQVRRWSRRDLGALARSMDNDAELVASFRKWRKAGQGRLARKFSGFPGGAASGT